MKTALLAWLLTALYYFYQYTLRSAPAVMMPQLSDAFGMTSLAVASMVGLFYYGYPLLVSLRAQQWTGSVRGVSCQSARLP